MGMVDTEDAFSSVSHSAPSPLRNDELWRRNSVLQLLRHQVGHIWDVTEMIFFSLNPQTSSLNTSISFLWDNTSGCIHTKI